MTGFSGIYGGDLALAQTLNIDALSGENTNVTALADFTNNGEINLSTDFDGRAATLIRAGTITNGASGTITFDGLASAATSRYLNAELLNFGLIDFAADSTAMTIGASGDNHTNSGTIINQNATSIATVLGASFTNLAGGTLAGLGELDFSATSLTNDGMISPGLSAGALTLDGNVNFGVTSNLMIELGGLTQGIEYDFLNVLDTINLDGGLSVSFIGGFESLINNSDSFTILSAGTRNGTFAGLADGATFLSADGKGFMTINYVGNNVVLGNFIANVPEPGTASLLCALGLVALMHRRRR
jgi:hypothetical protein